MKVLKPAAKQAGNIDKLSLDFGGLEPSLPVIFLSSQFQIWVYTIFHLLLPFPPDELLHEPPEDCTPISSLHLSLIFLGPHIHVNASICHFLLPVIIIEIYWDKMR